jgi:hypothetical protein
MASNSRVGLHLFHLLGVVPFLFYVTLSRAAMPDAVFYVLAALGAILILYHGGKAAYRWYTGSTYWWVNAIHAFYLGPLLLYIGLNKKTAPRASYEALMLFTFAALGYHLKLLADDLAAPYGAA